MLAACTGAPISPSLEKREPDPMLACRIRAVGNAAKAFRIVRLTAPGIFVHGVMRGITNTSLHVNSVTEISADSRVEVRIPFCRPFAATVLYCRPYEAGFRISLHFPAIEAPPIEEGELVWADSLEDHRTTGCFHVLDRTRQSITLVGTDPLREGTWLRIETDRVVAFGDVESVKWLSNSYWAVGVKVDAVVACASDGDPQGSQPNGTSAAAGKRLLQVPMAGGRR